MVVGVSPEPEGGLVFLDVSPESEGPPGCGLGNGMPHMLSCGVPASHGPDQKRTSGRRSPFGPILPTPRPQVTLRPNIGYTRSAEGHPSALRPQVDLRPYTRLAEGHPLAP